MALNNPRILLAWPILTLDPAQPQALAVAVGSAGPIAAEGDLAHG